MEHASFAAKVKESVKQQEGVEDANKMKESIQHQKFVAFVRLDLVLIQQVLIAKNVVLACAQSVHQIIVIAHSVVEVMLLEMDFVLILMYIC